MKLTKALAIISEIDFESEVFEGILDDEEIEAIKLVVDTATCSNAREESLLKANEDFFVKNQKLRDMIKILITDFERVTKMCAGYQCDSCPHYYKGKYGYYPYCSECKHEPQGREMTKFCPNCGAKMDGD